MIVLRNRLGILPEEPRLDVLAFLPRLEKQGFSIHDGNDRPCAPKPPVQLDGIPALEKNIIPVNRHPRGPGKHSKTLAGPGDPKGLSPAQGQTQNGQPRVPLDILKCKSQFAVHTNNLQPCAQSSTPGSGSTLEDSLYVERTIFVTDLPFSVQFRIVPNNFSSILGLAARTLRI